MSKACNFCSPNISYTSYSHFTVRPVEREIVSYVNLNERVIDLSCAYVLGYGFEM